MKENKHFKLSDEDSTSVFDSHKKTAIFVAVFVTIILCAVILILINGKEKKSNNNFDENAKKQIELVNNYQKEASQIVNNFLSQRTLEQYQTKENYQKLINSVLEDVLNLIVPAEFKDFHLKLVVLLDKEVQNDGGLNVELEDEWNKLLDENDWIMN